MLPWQPFLAFYIWGAHWRHLKNMTEPSMCGSDAALYQITLTTCFSLFLLVALAASLLLRLVSSCPMEMQPTTKCRHTAKVLLTGDRRV